MYTVYVLKSSDGRLYKGLTNNIQRRIYEHKSGKTRTTARMKGLNLVYSEQYDSFNEARKRELYFKTAAGRKFIKKKLGP
ncbi:MAG: GIY-YIG nuclease family protein [Candidatus Pacebacteria bacterium]|nr:GIY-YIG nuclease family protein [Candidatus Paceibacterota bacterium]